MQRLPLQMDHRLFMKPKPQKYRILMRSLSQGQGMVGSTYRHLVMPYLFKSKEDAEKVTKYLWDCTGILNVNNDDYEIQWEVIDET